MLPSRLAAGLEQRHIPGLDGIRALAVSLVILYHCGLPLPGGTGVLLFFALSGFLITWLLLEEARVKGSVSLRNFYVRRTLRIIPPFYIYAAVVLAFAFLRHHPVNYPQLIASLLYFNNYWQGIFGDPNTGFSHTWSLAVEEQFYLIWPGIFLLLLARPARMVSYLAWAVAAIWCYRLALVFAFHANQGYIYEAFDARADSLTIGCLLAVAAHQGRATRFFRIVCSTRLTILFTLAAFGLSTAAELRYGTDYRDTIGLTINAILSCMLIVQAIAGFLPFFDKALIVYLGRISYGMYLWQQIVVEVAGKALTHVFPGIPAAPRIILEYAAVVVVASISWYFAEKPILGLKKRFGAIT